MEHALVKFDKILPNRFRNECRMIFYTFYITKCHITFHEINQFYLENKSNLLIVDQKNSELIHKLELIRKDIDLCLAKKQEISANKEENDFPLDYYSYIKLFKNFVNCYYALCCYHWHKKQYKEIQKIISEEILKIGNNDADIPYDYKLIYYPWYLLTFLMEDNGDQIHEEYKEFVKIVPPSFKYDENNENYKYNVSSTPFINFWCMNILYIYLYLKEEFEKNKRYLFKAILYFLKKVKMAKYTNLYMISTMVFQKMKVKMVDEDEEISSSLEENQKQDQEYEKTSLKIQVLEDEVDYEERTIEILANQM